MGEWADGQMGVAGRNEVTGKAGCTGVTAGQLGGAGSVKKNTVNVAKSGRG